MDLDYRRNERFFSKILPVKSVLIQWGLLKAG